MEKEKRKLTYTELVDDCIDDIDRLYARFGGLRDVAQGKEKDPFNNGRGALSAIRTQLSQLKDRIYANGRHDMEVGNWSGEARLKTND